MRRTEARGRTARPRDLDVVALVGSRVVFGAERGNAEALAALQADGARILCVVRDEVWTRHVREHYAACGLQTVAMPHTDRWLPGWRWRVTLRNPGAWIVGNLRLLRLLRERRPTHLHAFHPFLLLSFLPAVVLARVPVVYRAGDAPVLHNVVWRLGWALARRVVRRFVANSEFVAARLRESGVPPERIEVIYNRPPRRVPADAGQRDRIGSATRGHRCIAFVGQIAPHKGFGVLVQAFARLAADCPDARLVVAGRLSDAASDDWARAQRDAIGRDPALAPRVVFLGEIDAVPQLLEGCELIAVPSLFEEPAANVVVEAKQAAIPAVVFPVGGLPELVRHDEEGWVCRASTVEALHEGLASYLAGPRGRAAAHGRAARRSLARLGNDRFTRRWRDAYLRALAPSPVRAGEPRIHR